MKAREYNDIMDALGHGPKAVNTAALVLESARKNNVPIDDIIAVSEFWREKELERLADDKMAKERIAKLPECPYCKIKMREDRVPEESAVIYRCLKCKYSRIEDI